MEYRLGIYEKAMPNEYTWRERLEAVKKGGFDFLEISVDESDARLARLEWSDGEIRELYDLSRSVGLPIETMCLSGHRKYPMGSGVPKIRARSMDIMKKAIRLADGLGCGSSSWRATTYIMKAPPPKRGSASSRV